MRADGSRYRARSRLVEGTCKIHCAPYSPPTDKNAGGPIRIRHSWYHLRLFNREGGCLAAKLRPGNVHSARGPGGIAVARDRPRIDGDGVASLESGCNEAKARFRPARNNRVNRFHRGAAAVAEKLLPPYRYAADLSYKHLGRQGHIGNSGLKAREGKP